MFKVKKVGKLMLSLFLTHYCAMKYITYMTTYNYATPSLIVSKIVSHFCFFVSFKAMEKFISFGVLFINNIYMSLKSYVEMTLFPAKHVLYNVQREK